MMMIGVLWQRLCTRLAKWVQQLPKVMKQSQKMKHHPDMPMPRFEHGW